MRRKGLYIYGAMFTDRFIRIPIKVYDTEMTELLGGEKVYEDSWMKLNPMEISQYKPTTDNSNDDLPCTYISMKNGDGFYCYMTTKEFEKLLNEHQK